MKGKKLFCDNPQCVRLIEDDRIAYNRKENEIYHASGYCAVFASAHKTLKSGKMAVTNVSYIDRKAALELLASGKLKQEGLERKTE